MRAIGDHEDVPHTLIPLTLAVGLVRSKAYGPRAPDGDSIAVFIAGVVPLYEFSHDPSIPPRHLGQTQLDGGLFRGGGKELRYLDGRATRQYLAVNAVDLECVIAMLKDPIRTAEIRSRYTRLRSQKLKARSMGLRAAAAKLRAEAQTRRLNAARP